MATYFHLVAMPHSNPLVSFPNYVVTKQKLIVGRSTKCDIIIEDDSISREHAELEITPDGMVVRDLNSTNGTAINGVAITAESRVRCDDTLHFANVSYFVQSIDGLSLEDPKTTIAEARNPNGETEDSTLFARVAQLSESQRRVLDLALKGMPEKQMAKLLTLSRFTVHNHLRAICTKLKVRSRPELMALLLKRTVESDANEVSSDEVSLA